jgi:predicted metal-dependent hydrolase
LYPEKYVQFLVHFHGNRDYFECHEILEEYWKESNDTQKDSIWVGFIQLAVSRYHHRRGNFNGAQRTLKKAIRILSLKANGLIIQGLDVNVLFPLLTKLIGEIEKEECYQSINLPVIDPTLLNACIKRCEELGFIWGESSNLEDESIVHRHKLRDRTMVIEERMESLRNRKGNE